MSHTHRSALMPCSEAVRRLWDYLDESGHLVERERVEEHLALCRRCCGELEFVRHLRRVLADQSTEELPPDGLRRLERFLEEEL